MIDAGEPAALERNRRVSARFNDEVKNQHRLDAIDELLSPAFVDHSAPPGFTPDRDGVRAFFAHYLQAFPDLTCTVRMQVAEGDRVVDYFTFEGTHRGEFMGIPPTGRRIRYDGMHIFELAEGQIVGHWSVLDMLTMLTQLGALPGGRG